MKSNTLGIFLYKTAQPIFTALTAASFYILYDVLAMSSDPYSAVSRYHSFPYMTEHILAGVLLYLAFANIIIRFWFRSVHDIEK